MAISVFPAGGGEFVTNDFVVDMNDTTNNVIDLGRSYAIGAYEISLASGDTSFDIYAISADGQSAGYTNNATLVTTGAFTQLAILGVATDERITFSFSGTSNDSTSEGDAVGAGAYLESITPSDLPNQDDTANIVGGNFASDVEIYFESGTVSTEAKNIVRSDSTALVVTRPDQLDPALDPWDVRVVNPGIPEPTGSDAHILAGTVDAGAVPVWTTTSPLDLATAGSAYSKTLEATDPDTGLVTYSITSGSLPTGLSLDSSTGVISGTPSTGSETFTVAAIDSAGNENERDFDLPVALATGGTVEFRDGFITHVFLASDDFVAPNTIPSAEYLLIAGGGGGASGGGGAGGYLSGISGETGAGGSAVASPIEISSGTHAVAVGAGGTGNNRNSIPGQGGDSSFGSLLTAVGGGHGGAISSNINPDAGDGGSGGGADRSNFGGNAGSGTPGQGFDGFRPAPNGNGLGAGGGASQDGGFTNTPTPGISSSTITGSSVEYAQGGSGSTQAVGESSVNLGSGGRSGRANDFTTPGQAGFSGAVVIRYT